MQRSSNDTNFEMSLRDQLIAAQHASQAQAPTSHPPRSGPERYPDPSSSSPDGDQIDPSIGEPRRAQLDIAMHGGLEDINGSLQSVADDNQGSRRQLSTSKRAAQNRAAQRAFRQRKEVYITSLEKQVKNYRVMEEDIKTLQQENYQLREYILSLQARLLETSSESDIPAAPPQSKLFDKETDVHPDDRPGAPSRPYLDMVGMPDLEEDNNGINEQTVAAVPTAIMESKNDPLPQRAVEQLQAAAAEAGELETATA